MLNMKKRRMEGVPAAAYISGVFLVGAIIVTPIALLWGTSVTAFTSEDWLYIMVLTLVAGCLGQGMMAWAQKHVKLGIASVMTLGTIIVSSAGGWLFFGQALNAVQVATGAVVLAAIGAVLVIQINEHPDDEMTLPTLTEAPFGE